MMPGTLCHKPLVGRSKFESLIKRRCYKTLGHSGKCEEYPYLSHLEESHPRVAAKIKRDATKTTGAAWKSDDAGPNRIDRWVMLLSDADLASKFKINIASMKPQVQSKLREKAATYEECMEVAAKLALSVYQMRNAPEAPAEIRDYLIDRFAGMDLGSTRCIVCLEHLDFSDFEQAQRGRAHIETAHANPRSHSPENVGFAHRECNIAQGSMNLSDFYNWIRAILNRVDGSKS